MAKPISATELENAAKALKYDTLYDSFFSESKQSKYEDHCKVFDAAGKQKDEDAKKICHKLAFFLEKIAENKKKEERDKYCNYLPYWLYGEIGKIYKGQPSTELKKIPFFNDLTSAKDNIDKQIKVYKCYLPYDNSTSLDELIKGKFAFIYFNKYTDIKNDVTVSPNKDKCEKYSTYLDRINSFYKIIEKQYCNSRSWWPPPVPKYFKCDKNLSPESLLSKAKQCAGTASGSSGGGGGGLGIFSFLSFGSSSNTRSSGNGRGAEAEGSRNAADQAKDRGKAATSGSLSGGDSRGSASSQGTGREPSSEKAVNLSGLGTGSASRVGLTGPQNQAGREALSQSGVLLNNVGQLSNGNNDGLSADPGNVHTEVTGEVLDSSDIFQKISQVLKSDYFRHSIVVASAVGVFIFYSYFFNVNKKWAFKYEHFVMLFIICAALNV
ncbi:hypothetical protein PVMG_02994 [Plasmodium vivax Mauritania I]|uniref:Variable surface protein Vir12 n=1 Tax=Plasmodium vivax Mauritania I TaxID=1035515 RepID=A0A0J9TGI0_PLAVI|nr:hypothetical protein PVMG_02994 [Plasmodium vivax Mauritania I]